MAKDIRVDIGFAGGGSTALEVPEGLLESLTTSVRSGNAEWFSVSSSDGGETLVDLSKVVYVRVAASNRSIGFAHA